MAQDDLDEERRPKPPSRKVLLWVTGGGFMAAAVIAACFVLPTEFHIDPTGFGRLSGLDRLAGAKTMTVAVANTNGKAAGPGATANFYARAYRTDTIDIPLTSAETNEQKSELEYKVAMKAGDGLVFSWTVSGLTNPEEFYYDFHGETPVGPGEPVAKVVEYKQATGLQSNGILVAPLSGIHGWYLQNQSVGPVVVHLKLSGFYDLVPPGQYGNLAGVKAYPPKT